MVIKHWFIQIGYDDLEGDIGRQRRQREVITAIVKKLLNLDGLTQYKKIPGNYFK